MKVANKNINLGAIYTPEILSDYVANVLLRCLNDLWSAESQELYPGSSKETQQKRILHMLNKVQTCTILDPACGDASLLLSLEKCFKEEFTYLLSQLNEIGLAFFEKTNSKNPVTFGVDIDKESVINTSMYLEEFSKNNICQRQFNIKCADSLVPIQKTNRREGWFQLFPQVMESGGFCGLIANPPWGADTLYDREELIGSGYQLAKGQYDSYELFIELSLDLVKNGAPLALIIPDSILLPEHKRLRNMLLQRTKIKLIARLGEKFFPSIFRSCVIILCVKIEPDKNTLTQCFRLNHSWRDRILLKKDTLFSAEKELSHYVPQESFIKDSEIRFSIDVKIDESELIKKIKSDNINWSDILNSGRGVEISKKGNIIRCPKCYNWQPEPRVFNEIAFCVHCKNNYRIFDAVKKAIVTKVNNNEDSFVPFLVGEDIHRYNALPKHFISLNVPGINYKRHDDFKASKLIIRKTGLGIHAAIDNIGYYTSQTIFHYRLKDLYNEIYTLEYILGVLNSRILFYFYIKMYGECEWRSHPYLTQKVISQLPIRKIDLSSKRSVAQANAITELVKDVVASNIINSELDYEIECLVAGLYGLTSEECNTIIKTIENAQQLEAIRAMKLHNQDTFFPKNAVINLA